MTPIELL